MGIGCNVYFSWLQTSRNSFLLFDFRFFHIKKKCKAMIEIFMIIAFILCAKWVQVTQNEKQKKQEYETLQKNEIAKFKNELWHIVITSENEQDNTELRRYNYAKEMITKYNENGVQVYLCVYRENDVFETWNDYETRKEQFCKAKILERQRLFQRPENREFFLKYVLKKA